jgi:hypothetical protein
MSNCKYCGKPAGFLRNSHDECEQKFQSGREKISIAASRALSGEESFDSLVRTVNETEQSSFINPVFTKAILISAYETAVEQYLDDGILDNNEDTRLIELQKRFYLSQDDVDRNGAFTKVAKASMLRDVLNCCIWRNFSYIWFVLSLLLGVAELKRYWSRIKVEISHYGMASRLGRRSTDVLQARYPDNVSNPYTGLVV